MRFDTSRPAATGGRLHVFSIYSDFGTSRRIRRTVNAITRLAGHRWQYSSEMWRLDSISGCAPMKRIIALDGANSDILMAVIGSLDQRKPELIEWLDSLTPLPSDRFGLLIGLLGDEENKTCELDWVVKELIRCAEKTNRRFIWNWIGYHDDDDPDWLADAVSQLINHRRTWIEPQLGPALAAQHASPEPSALAVR